MSSVRPFVTTGTTNRRLGKAMPPEPPQRSWLIRPGTLALLGVLAVVAAYVWLSPEPEHLPEFRAFPHAYVAGPVFEPAQVVIRPGPLPRPSHIEEDGKTLWPAFTCSDNSLVPARNGQPCIFPLIGVESAMKSPPLPPHGTVLSGDRLRLAQPYLTPEAKAILASFAERMR